MFDQHIICRDGFSNVTQDNTIIGVRFLARLPYYRGLGLSMVEDLCVTLNGESIPREKVRLALRGREWTLDELETVYDERWNFGEKASITLLIPGGLKTGMHRVKLSEKLRISYLPFVPITTHETLLELSE